MNIIKNKNMDDNTINEINMDTIAKNKNKEQQIKKMQKKCNRDKGGAINAVHIGKEVRHPYILPLVTVQASLYLVTEEKSLENTFYRGHILYRTHSIYCPL